VLQLEIEKNTKNLYFGIQGRSKSLILLSIERAHGTSY